MELGIFLIGTLAAGIFLFLWAGFSQAVTTWGIRSVKALPTDAQGSLPTELERVAPPSGMYGVFNAQVAAFIAVRKGSYYNMGRYFALEFATQLGVGALLMGILALTGAQSDAERLGLVALVGLFAAVSIDFQYWNWWGFAARYALGFTVNRLAGYLIVTFALLNWLL
ncbi:MAG: hypothetical protein DYG88_16030 [Chloroflexi bacterium CFX4]|nr:hypothetical protein [Chloroflexi bacterium CFX4]MDL1921867.1 hypothetical protein [Chloroflexi bacterium CFX3]